MTKNDLMDILSEHGFLDYGSVISAKELRDFCDIEEIEQGSKDDFDRVALQELTYVDYIRNRLLNEGKYFKGERNNYRVLLPSENAEQVLSYMSSADKKLKRGIKLNKNTPVKYKINSNDEVRAMMKMENIKNEKRSKDVRGG